MSGALGPFADVFAPPTLAQRRFLAEEAAVFIDDRSVGGCAIPLHI